MINILLTKTALKVKFNVKFNSNHHFLCKWYLSDILFWYLNLSFPTKNQVENHIEVWQLLRDKKYGENFKNFMEHALCYFRLVFQLTTIRHRITKFQTGSIKTNHQWFATMNFRTFGYIRSNHKWNLAKGSSLKLWRINFYETWLLSFREWQFQGGKL